jgi:hypothetical protein
MPDPGVHPALLLCALGIVLSCLGCSPSEWAPVRYGAPLARDHAANLETNRCAHLCYEAAEDSSRFYACLATCPGVVRVDAATCEDPAETPEAFCYTAWVERPADASADSVDANAVFELFGAIVNGLLQAAASSGKSEHARRESGWERSEPRRERARPRRTEPSREPRRYVPATPRRR